MLFLGLTVLKIFKKAVNILTTKLDTQDESLTLANILTDFDKLRDTVQEKEYKSNKKIDDLMHIHEKMRIR